MSDNAGVERGTFVLRVPEPITAVRYDGTPEAAAAALALFVGSHAWVHEQNPRRLVLVFPDEKVTVERGAWVWYCHNGYDVAPAEVMPDAEFRSAYAPLAEGA